ncbi:hypothetical protein [Micromonospora costi]|uniref:Uncharacterized protein n=1 Tax=Micromonospora costi TaxID=1530042 RepID=A0A3B0A627_9ACTN|nr:hypothetical protein [Micromonospora costi]RKN55962.1 hypothetical protein D7193_15360 [Micromonospora costi]
MTPLRPVQIASGRHPFEMAVLLAAVCSGVALVVTDRRPASVLAAMPATVQLLWEVGLIVAGVIGLIGVTWNGDLSTSMGVEMIGIILLGTVTTMYAVALFVVSGSAAIAAGAFICAIAAASWARAVQVLVDLRRVGRAAQAGRTADVTLLVERDPS